MMAASSKVFNMDCMEGMAQYPDKYFELAIVDPPYGIGLGFSKSKKVKNGTLTSGHLDKGWNNSTPDEKYFIELFRVSKNYIIWGANYYWKYIPDCGAIIHNKMVSPFIASTYSHADIAATSLQKRVTMFSSQWSGNVQNGKMNTGNVDDYDKGLENRIHPTQKPIKLYKWILTNYAKPGDKILDTHLGSGSSRIAAYDLGFDFTGYELDKDYFEASEKRFQDHIKQLTIF